MYILIKQQIFPKKEYPVYNLIHKIDKAREKESQ